jgi:protein TonB
MPTGEEGAMGRHDDSFNREYPCRIRLFSLLTIMLVAGLFLLFPRANGESVVYGPPEVSTPEFVDLPPNTKWKQPPRIPRAYIPVNTVEAMEEKSFPEMDWNIGPIFKPPPALIPPRGIFTPYDEAPEPIGGYAALMKNVHYPQMAVMAGIEGRVVVHAYIDENGLVRKTEIIQGVPHSGLDEAAVKAVEQARFRPAMQRDIPVGVWIAIPVVFQIQH